MMERQNIGIADMKLARGQGTLVTYALGSCIGICLWDPLLKIGALVHIMLPINMETNRTSPFKYADTGIRLTISKMEFMGAKRTRIIAKIAGGAKMFNVPANSNLGNIGQRNIESVHQVLRQEGIRLLKEDVGGSAARTLFFDVATGEGTVKIYGNVERKL
ncbi:MAG TPA: chemotaxis protein CheD [Candidatus Butyricicoccus avistercoris]|uniref:Probable chemoreceptor glutamine deamidase CheD n=1 Tax=Candidatus Butyricicoccus avistercoris TaxID=2838518 RepID=A0A9D1PG59_9FIRM|nr:chemotaxis protein CheD [Candidatus Butyricicoccus avistercoris]